MPKEYRAIFSDIASQALQNGEAVFNNNFRSKNGCFHPEQPVYLPINESAEILKIVS